MASEVKTSSLSICVLIVDDDHRVLSAISQRLKDLGCRCVCCDNATEAMLQFAAGGIDLIVTDLTMPGMDGLSIVGLIRSQSDVPIIVASGHVEEYRHILSSYGDVTLIRKPLEAQSFIRCVSAAIAKTRKNNVLAN
jgi:CheY-like chemotaxis protein